MESASREKRFEMVESQIVSRGIFDKKVITAMSKIPRELFIPEEYTDQAYEDHPLSIGENQTISQPYIVALMTELLGLAGGEKMLEIGTGSGYQTAILAELSREIFTVERIEALSINARDILSSIGYKNVHFRINDGSLGWGEFAPYDRIIITAAAAEIPPPLMEQLATGGRIVIPVGGRFSQTLTVVEKSDKGILKRSICGCIFVPLVGKYSC